MSDIDLISTSEEIVRGEVISTKAHWVNNGKFIYTFTRLKVTDVLSGNHEIGSTITIVTPGGYDDEKDIGMRVSEQAEFEQGEDAIVYLVKAEGEQDAIDYSFLNQNTNFPEKIMRVNGYEQGKYLIQKNDKTSKTMIWKANENRWVELNVLKKELKNNLQLVKQ